MLIHILSLSLVLLQQCNTNNYFEKIYLPKDSDSKCNDGSSAYYYYGKPVNNQLTSKFIILFSATGWCNHEQFNTEFLEGCYQRLLNGNGQQLFNPDKKIRKDTEGILSGNPLTNPYFYDWNVIIISSCDGALNQGYSKEPFIYKNKQIWFRGQNNTIASLNDANKRFNLFLANEVLLGGCSSAGLSAIIWSNYIRDALPNSTKMWTFCDSGFYIDYKYQPNGQNRLRNQMMDIITYTNIDIDPINLECVQDNLDEKWKCLMAEYAVKYIKTPIFVSQFEYDQWHMRFILGELCENVNKGQGKCILCSNKIKDNVEQWKNYCVEKIQNILTNKQESYYWHIPCFYHCMHTDNKITYNKDEFSYQQQSLGEALYKWMYKS